LVKNYTVVLKNRTHDDTFRNSLTPIYFCTVPRLLQWYVLKFVRNREPGEIIFGTQAYLRLS